jgi:transaldolase
MIKLYSDGADFDGIVKASKDERIVGFTTNPTLMYQAGVTDYEKFAREIIAYLAEHRPETTLSLEVFSDELREMASQAEKIHKWGELENYKTYVKIPVTNTVSSLTTDLYYDLSMNGIRCNVTAVFTKDQIKEVIDNLNHFTPGIVSIFAGRIADAGQDPEEYIKFGVDYFASSKNANTNLEFLWASTREPFNYVQAERSGCDIITMPPAMINKMHDTFGKDLRKYSLETVNMFYNDAVKSGFKI